MDERFGWMDGWMVDKKKDNDGWQDRNGRMDGSMGIHADDGWLLGA